MLSYDYDTNLQETQNDIERRQAILMVFGGAAIIAVLSTISVILSLLYE